MKTIVCALAMCVIASAAGTIVGCAKRESAEEIAVRKEAKDLEAKATRDASHHEDVSAELEQRLLEQALEKLHKQALVEAAEHPRFTDEGNGTAIMGVGPLGHHDLTEEVTVLTTTMDAWSKTNPDKRVVAMNIVTEIRQMFDGIRTNAVMLVVHYEFRNGKTGTIACRTK